MSLIEHAIAASRKTAQHHDPSLANKPEPKVAILTCMDPRLNHFADGIVPDRCDILSADRRRSGGRIHSTIRFTEGR